MKAIKYCTLVFNFFFVSYTYAQQTWIRVNQLGYLTNDVKIAVLVSKDKNFQIGDIFLCNAFNEGRPYSENREPVKVTESSAWAGFEKTYRLNFSRYIKPGSYYLEVKNNNKNHLEGDLIKSPVFRIGNDIYNGTADFLLNYMRQQRCGYNPVLRDSCHTSGCFVVYGKEKNLDSVRLPIWGGWHDASDYLQYATTSANAVYQMLMAYQMNPKSFIDKYDAAGLPTPNGIPDILDEAKWGLDWLCRMNPKPDIMFNQIADDRDHRYMRMPNSDTITYDYRYGKARPVYLVTGEKQGLGKYKNRTTGVSSTAGKFASAFAAGARLLKNFYPNFSDSIQIKATEAYTFAKNKLGVCQTAPNRAPYFYEEDNFYDDLELAAIQLYKNTRQPEYLNEAIKFGRLEGESKWMGKDTARHYQYYPFVNVGHAEIFNQINDTSRQEFVNIYKSDLQKLLELGKNNPFYMGVPFVWCSNNYVAAALTEVDLFLSSNDQHPNSEFIEMSAALRDWLFGCNPWGTSMIYGLPRKGVSPRDPHSAFTHIGKYNIDGGLVDGPIYGSIFKQLIGLTLFHPDSFAQFQSPLVIYHDDYCDYSSNEPTMDGTASLTYFLAAMQHKADTVKSPTEKKIAKAQKDKYGAITRFDTTEKTIHLVFTGHEFADGGEIILRTLRQENIKALFFFTGDFIRKYKSLVKQLHEAGHFIGMHSDKHLLYCDWTKRDSTLITASDFMQDLNSNSVELYNLNIYNYENSFFMPPYEWYNMDIAEWTTKSGNQLINFTSGTSSNADYTTPEDKNYKSSATILKSIDDYEKKNNFNGFIFLSHMGTDPKRTDKFYLHLSGLIRKWKHKGYSFDRL